MSTLFIDYREEVKKTISENYEPADFITKEVDLTTGQLTANLQTVLPFNAVDEHLVYECLIELGFKPQEKPNEPLTFIWYFKRKRNF